MGIILNLITNILIFLFIIWFIDHVIAMYLYKKVINSSKRHPEIYKKLTKRLRFRIFNITLWGIPPIIFFKLNSFNQRFNKIYFYKEVLETEDHVFIKLIDRYKIITFIWSVTLMAFAFIILSIVIITLILFLIAIIINGSGAFS